MADLQSALFVRSCGNPAWDPALDACSVDADWEHTREMESTTWGTRRGTQQVCDQPQDHHKTSLPSFENKITQLKTSGKTCKACSIIHLKHLMQRELGSCRAACTDAQAPLVLPQLQHSHHTPVSPRQDTFFTENRLIWIGHSAHFQQRQY